MLVCYVHKMFEHVTVICKNLIIYPIPPAHYVWPGIQQIDTAYHNTLHSRMIRAGGVEGAIQQKEA